MQPALFLIWYLFDAMFSWTSTFTSFLAPKIYRTIDGFPQVFVIMNSWDVLKYLLCGLFQALFQALFQVSHRHRLVILVIRLNDLFKNFQLMAISSKFLNEFYSFEYTPPQLSHIDSQGTICLEFKVFDSWQLEKCNISHKTNILGQLALTSS